MKKLIPTKFYYNFKGFDINNREISYGSGTIDSKDVIGTNILDFCINKAKLADSNVVNINLITLTPLEFDIIE